MTAKRDLRVYLHDILSAIALITEYTVEGEEIFLTDLKTQDAVLHQFSVIGEAASRLPRTMRTRYPDVPWKLIIGMRNIIIHDYSEIKMPRIWEVVEQDLPPLRKTIETMLQEIPPS